MNELSNLDFSHLTELKNIYTCITEIYMEKKKPNNIDHQ